jgi:hypothetical protein
LRVFAANPPPPAERPAHPGAGARGKG